VAEEAGKGLVIKTVDVPEPGKKEVLIKVHTCGVCHSDSATIEGHMGPMAKFPLIPGHEVVGTIVKLGSDITRFKEGDLVGGGWHGGHDGTCKTCQRGLFQICDNEAINGVTRNGGFAEYCTLREEAAVPLPDHLDKAEMAPLLCAGVTVFNGIRKQQVPQGGTVAIVGLGGLGHLALQYCRKMGYRTVALSSSDAKKEFADKLGATDYISGDKQAEGLQKMGGADLIVITAPNPEFVTKLATGVGPLGKILILAPIGEVKINVVPLIMKGASLAGWPSGHALDSEEAIEFAQVQGVKCMVEKFPLDKVNEALQHMLEGKVRFRSVLTMD